MRLLLRADAVTGVGTGHVGRCVSFAEEAIARGWVVHFSGRLSAAGWFADRLAELGVTIHPPADEPASLAGVAASIGARVVLLDHYEFTGDVVGAVERAGATLVSMEDAGFGRRPAHVAVDCGLASTARPARPARPQDRFPAVLVGPKYAPLRAAVRAARERRASAWREWRVAGAEPPRIVVVLGGTATGEAVRAVMVALRDTGRPMRVRALAPEPLEPPCCGPGQHLVAEPLTPDLPDLLATADLVVSAAGVLLLELCCIGVPAALVQVADNQAAGYRAAVACGAAVGLGDLTRLLTDTSAATATLDEVLADEALRLRLAGAASHLVDGLGAGRVLDRAAAVAIEA